MVTQAAENPDFPDASEQNTGAEEGSAFDAAVSKFLSYLQGYRHYSPWTVGAYRIDLREFQEFLLEQGGRVPAPAEITRPQVVAWGLKLTGMKPLTIRRKYGCLSSFFSFLQDPSEMALPSQRDGRATWAIARATLPADCLYPRWRGICPPCCPPSRCTNCWRRHRLLTAGYWSCSCFQPACAAARLPASCWIRVTWSIANCACAAKVTRSGWCR